MRSRGLVVALAVLLAVAAAGAVVLYTNGVKKAAESGGSLTTVIVATQDIPANTSLNSLIESGGFKELAVPADAVVDGAVTSLTALRGQTTTAPIVANEQLTSSNLSSGEQVAGGMLGISKGHVAAHDQAERAARRERQHPARRQHHRSSPRSPAHRSSRARRSRISSTAAPPTTDRQELPDFTGTLIPTVRVLQVVNPGVDEAGNATGDSVTLTLDLLPADAQNLIARAADRHPLHRPPASG